MDLCQQGALDNGGLPTGMAPTLNKNNIKFGCILGIQEHFTGILGVLFTQFIDQRLKKDHEIDKLFWKFVE